MKLIDKDKVISILSSKITDIKLDMKCGFLEKRKGNEKILVLKHIISLINTLKEEPFNYRNVTIKQKDFASCIQDGDKIVTNEDGTHFNISQLERVAKKEPKFKVGQWIIDTQDGTILHINKVHEYSYEVTNLKGGVYQISRCSIETSYKPWTIQDAKDGDVLASNNGNTFIYHKHGNNCVYYHCSINYFDNITINSSWNVLGIKPATKEQRGLLFQKMKEAGYEWDAKKKELKLLITNGGDFESENCEQKSAWSEKDENNLKAVCAYLQDYSRLSKISDIKRFNEYCDWLKSLKDKIKGE